MEDSELKGFAQRLTDTRKKLQLTQAELGVQAGVTQQSICKYESGVSRGPRYPVLIRLAKLLGVTPGWLLHGDSHDREMSSDTMLGNLPYLSQEAIKIALVFDQLPKKRKQALKILILGED